MKKRLRKFEKAPSKSDDVWWFLDEDQKWHAYKMSEVKEIKRGKHRKSRKRNTDN